jgi:hypothetical protein
MTPRACDPLRSDARAALTGWHHWAALTLELAIPLLEEAAGGHVEGLIGDTDPPVAVRETLEREPFDEVIVSPRSSRVTPRDASDPSLPGRRRSRSTRPLPSVPLAAGNPLAGERPADVTERQPGALSALLGD